MLGDVCGLTQFGVNLTRLKPGACSAHRHWHENEDEFIYIVEGEATLIEDGGETVLRAGDCAGWKAGVANGHCLVNKSDNDVVFIEIGTRAPTEQVSIIRMSICIMAARIDDGAHFTRKNGESYPK